MINSTESVTQQLFEPIRKQIIRNSCPYKGLQISSTMIPVFLACLVETVARSIFALFTLPATIYYAQTDGSIFKDNITALTDSSLGLVFSVIIFFLSPFRADASIKR